MTASGIITILVETVEDAARVMTAMETTAITTAEQTTIARAGLHKDPKIRQQTRQVIRWQIG